jgi:hypothetical protein
VKLLGCYIGNPPRGQQENIPGENIFSDVGARIATRPKSSAPPEAAGTSWKTGAGNFFLIF